MSLKSIRDTKNVKGPDFIKQSINTCEALACPWRNFVNLMCNNFSTMSTMMCFQYSDYECICPAPFGGQQCTRECSRSVMDVAFVADMSDEVDESSEMLQLLQLLAYGLPVAADHVRLALVVYSTNVTVRFYLNTYSVKSQVLVYSCRIIIIIIIIIISSSSSSSIAYRYLTK